MATYVMKFGVKRFLENRDLAERQMRQVHDTYNALLAVELKRRAAYRDTRSRHVPGLNELEDALAELNERIEERHAAIKAKRQSATAKTLKPNRDKTKDVRGVRAVDADAELAELKELKAQRKDLSARVKDLRQKFRGMTDEANAAFKARKGKHAPTVQAEVTAAVYEEMLAEDWPEAWKEIARQDMEANREIKALYAARTFHFDTFNTVREDVQRALKTAQGDPRFRSWAREQCGKKIGVQVSGPTTFLLGERRNRGRGLTPQSNRARHEIAVARIRIGSDDARRPIWVAFETILHRPIPEDAKVKWAYLVPQRCGGRIKYTLQLTVETERPLRERAPGKGLAEVRLRWSKSGDTFTCAEVNGTPVELPVKVVSGQVIAEQLRGAADRIFDGARKEVRAELEKGGDHIPEWAAEECRHMANWRAHGKLRAIAHRWAEERLGERRWELWRAWREYRLALTDDKTRDLYQNPHVVEEWCATSTETGVDAFAFWLLIWAQKDRHLLEWADGQRARTLRHRKDFYRSLAAKLSTTFETCQVGKLDLSSMRKRKKPDQNEDPLEQVGRKNMQRVAPGELKEALLHAFGRERFSEDDSSGTTRKAEKQTKEVDEAAAAE